MILLEDTRNQIGKHKQKHDWFHANGIEVHRTKLTVGDYTLPANQNICIDTKKNLLELCGNVCQQHERFIHELELARKLEIQLIILCEHSISIKSLEDVKIWKNPRLKYNNRALTGEKLYKILKSIEERHGCRFEFCSKSETGQKIIELLTENRGGDGAVTGNFKQVSGG